MLTPESQIVIENGQVLKTTVLSYPILGLPLVGCVTSILNFLHKVASRFNASATEVIGKSMKQTNVRLAGV